MLGARALVSSLVDAGVDVCFMNPGTSEMHVVAALDDVPALRSVLTVFEGVATGAADGYARIAGRPAAVLLHLGPGQGNGLANLHNARRAHSPLVLVVGAHARDHTLLDAPLQSDIEALARTVSGWVRTTGHPRDVGRDTVEAVQAATTGAGQVATLVLPADVSWLEGAEPAPPRTPYPRDVVTPDVVAAVAEHLGPTTTLLLGGGALTGAGLAAASRIAAATGARLVAETFPARIAQGAGVVSVPRLGYLAEQAVPQLEGSETMVLAGARWPVTFFAYPGRPSDLVPEGCAVHRLVDVSQDAEAAVVALADLVAPGTAPVLAEASLPEVAEGDLTTWSMACALAAALPEGAIVVDEAITMSAVLPHALAGAPRHDVLTLTGGAIGQGMPVATGAAVAAPDRPVVNVQADGSALYTVQSLWTQAREQLDVTTLLLNNSAYAILRMELGRVGGGEPGPRALEMLDLRRPDVSFVDVARGLGVPAVRVTTGPELLAALRRAIAEPGPHLVEAIVPPVA